MRLEDLGAAASGAVQGIAVLRGRVVLQRGAVAAEPVDHLAEHLAGPLGAEQAHAVGDRMPADAHALPHRPRDLVARERGDRADERLGGAGGVEHVALADRARADCGAQVVVPTDGEHGAPRSEKLGRRDLAGG
jgi:hypothetical protein